MILPIRAYGDPVLRKQCREITKDFPNLSDLIGNMFETMYASNGVGLAAPQVGRDIRLFVIDSNEMLDDESDERGIKRAFINAYKVNEEGEAWDFTEGCLSIPGVREDVNRKNSITLKYVTEDWKEVTETFHGMTARVIQHEYDHIDGVLFVDYLSAFKRQLLKGKLSGIAKGKVDVGYKMQFPKRN
jgi:peptide deformylase